jgi:hypothetical protein
MANYAAHAHTVRRVAIPVHMYTVYDRIFGGIPAKNTVHTPCVSNSGQPDVHKSVYAVILPELSPNVWPNVYVYMVLANLTCTAYLSIMKVILKATTISIPILTCRAGIPRTEAPSCCSNQSLNLERGLISGGVI